MGQGPEEIYQPVELGVLEIRVIKRIRRRDTAAPLRSDVPRTAIC
jgi:hypothetical protein